MTTHYIVTPEGVGRLWMPTKTGIETPTRAYLEELAALQAPFGHQITEDRGQAFGAHRNLLLMGALASAGAVTPLNRRGLFAAFAAGAVALVGSHLLSKDALAAAMGGGFSGGGSAAGTDTMAIPWWGDPAGFTGVAAEVDTHGNGTQRTPSDGNDGMCRQAVPVASTLKSAYWFVWRTGTAGTAAQLVTHRIRKNDTTDTSGCTSDWNTNPTKTQETGLSLAFAAGDDFLAKTTAPGTWTTPPTGNRIRGTLYFSIP